MMKKHLNNKGYMLVEIILASVIAMGVAYFLTELTIKLKNKNDDLLVKTLVATDQAIIYNEIMDDLYTNPSSDACTRYQITKSTFTYSYNGISLQNVISEYADVDIDNKKCGNTYNDDGTVTVNVYIPIKVKQLPDEDFSINIKHKLS